MVKEKRQQQCTDEKWKKSSNSITIFTSSWYDRGSMVWWAANDFFEFNFKSSSRRQFFDYIIIIFYCNHCFFPLQINPFVASNRNAFMAWHVMRRQKFYVKLMPIHRLIHSNGRLTIRQKHLKCRKVITEYIHHEHQRSLICQWR